MNTIKLAVFGLSIFLGTMSFAQEQKSELTKEQRKEQRMEEFSKELNLSEQQKVEFTALRKDAQEARLTLRNDETLDEAEKKSAMKKLHMENKAKMAEILTPEQTEKLKEMKKERRENHKTKYPDKEYKGKKRGAKKDAKPHKERLQEAPIEK